MEVGSNIQIDVRGELFGQACNNTFHYIIQTLSGEGMIDAVTAFRTDWRANILPLLVVDYQVLKYIGAEISGFEFLHAAPDHRYGIRYIDSVELVGDTSDNGLLDEDALPSYAAVSATKKVGTITDFDEVDLNLERRLRGGVRFSGLPLSALEPETPNKLEADVYAAWNTAVPLLKSITTAGLLAAMEVISTTKNNAPRVLFDGPDRTPRPARGTVSSLVVSPFVSSQVSRKETVARLG